MHLRIGQLPYIHINEAEKYQNGNLMELPVTQDKNPKWESKSV